MCNVILMWPRETVRHRRDTRNNEEVLQSDAIEEPFMVPQRTFQPRVLSRTDNGVSKNFKKRLFKAPFMVPQRTFKTRVL